MRRAASTIQAVIDGQRGHLFPWSPVCLALGIGGYFSLTNEPNGPATALLTGLGLLLLLLAWRFGRHVPLITGLALIVLGALIAMARTHSVAEPVLGFRYYGPIEGRIVLVDRSASDKVRLTLDQVILSRVDPDKTPARVRVSLHGEQGYIIPEPGLRVILTGHLSGPEGPVEPGGFDFQRQAWFKRLGAVGYTRTPVLTLAPAEMGRAGLFVQVMRARISSYVQNALPGRAGAFAAAVTTGDRSGMDQETLEALRVSNLAHLLAISGLHMGLLTGLLFAATRYGLALFPRLALGLSLHKIGAVVALLGGAIYLALSGGSVATERAFVMVAAMFTAVLFNRRALTLRAVALAALVILVLRPEALLGPGFQMSFSATVALIWVFSSLRDTGMQRWPPAARWLAALVISSAVAGFATAPIAAAHFNRIPHYGLIANLLAVPVMGSIVMPGAIIAAVLAPLGLADIGLKIMSFGIEWILSVAMRVSTLEGAISSVPAPQTLVLPIFALGALWLVLWQGRARLAGLVPVVMALGIWTQVERPALLISGDGGLLGLMTEEGRALSKPRGQGFAASSWLENDGDGVDQATAHGRLGFEGEKGDLWFDLGGTSARHLSGRGASDRVARACAEADLVVVAAEVAASGPCRLIQRGDLAETGPVALYATAEGLRLEPTRGGARPWTRGGRQ